MLAKLILNIILVPIPSIGVNGAAIASVVCHLVAFIISITVLKRTIKINLGMKRFVIKPILATFMMGICSYFVYSVLFGIINKKLATIIALLFAVFIYAAAVIVLKIFKKEEIQMLPAGNKICAILEKLKIY